MDQNVITRIEDLMSRLTKVQQLIAISIIQDPLAASFHSINELAVKVGVSPASIVRFSQKITDGGYPQLQSELQSYIQDISNPIKRLELNVITNSEDDIMLTQIYETQLNNLRNTFNQNLISSVKHAVDVLIGAERIYTSGSRGSYSAAYYLGHHLNRVLGNADIVPDGDRLADFTLKTTNRDVAVFFCLPRYSERLLRVVKILQAIGTKIITINGSPRSPFVEHSDVSFYAFHKSSDFHNSLLSAMLIAEMLISSVISKNMDSSLNNLARMEQLFQTLQQFNEHN